MSESVVLSKRLFIGGLSEGVSESELLERFSRFGKVSNVSLKTRIDDSGFSTFQNAKWKGSVMKLQYAKESVLERLQREREENASGPVAVPEQKLEKLSSPEIPVTAKGVPGTPLPGKKDWVVGKYGRAVPVLKLKKSYKIPMVKHDPSKYCHAAKVFKDELVELAVDGSFTKLTWEINEPDSAMTRKRKGEFPENSIPQKKKPALSGISISAAREKATIMSLSNSFQNNQGTSSPVPRESNEIEFVKIGAVIAKSTSLNTPNISNKFDSDIESDSESKPEAVVKQLKPKPNFATKSKSFGQLPENAGSVKSNADNGLKGLRNGGEIVSHSLPKAQPERDVSQPFNKAGIPEFKGLSMLTMLDKPSIKSDNATSPVKVPQPPNIENSRSKPAKTNSSNGPGVDKNVDISNMSSAFNVSKTGGSHTISLRENSVIAKPDKNTNIATPSPFPARRDNDFKTSTPNAPVDSSKQDIIPRDSYEIPSHKLIPEFKGLGMLANYNVDGEKKSQSQELLKKQIGNGSKSAEKDSSLLNSSSSLNNSKQKETVSMHKQNVKSAIGQGNTSASTSSVSSKASDEDSAKNSKSKRREHDTNFDSDSSAGTDEIILRHKEQKISYTSLHAKPAHLEKQPVLGNKPSKENVLSDSKHLMSEFISGVDEYSNAQGSNVTPAHRDIDGDSYDSDLDSNDFALVAKKLRQQAMRSKQGLTENMGSRDKKRKDHLTQKDNAMSTTKESVDVKRADVSDLQNKLINIAGSKNKPLKSPEKLDKESVNHKKQDVLSEKDKHRVANEKRLEAVKLQAKQRQQQQQLMQQALKNVDSLDGNKKRIVFESSEDDSDDNDKNNNSENTAAITSSTAEGQKQEKPGPVLFASSDEDESEEEDYDEMFKSKPQFEGKKGEKLLKLENRFGDKRFKLDARFAATDSEEEQEDDSNNEDENTNGPSSDIVGDADTDLSCKLKAEKSSSLKVLEDVIGKSTLDRFSEKISRNTKKIIDMNSVRFDPTKMTLQSPAPVPSPEKKTVANSTVSSKAQPKEAPDSAKLKRKEKKLPSTDLQKTAESDGTSKADSNEEVNNNQAERECQTSNESKSKKDEPGTEGKTNVELSSSLLNLFKAEAGGRTDKNTGFSFAQQFGDAGSDDDEGEEDDDVKRHNVQGNELMAYKNKAIVNKLESPAKTEKMIVDSDQEDKVTNHEKSEKGTGDTTKMSSSSESDLSIDEEEEEEEGKEEGNSEEPHVSVGVKPKHGIDANLQGAGRADVRFTNEKWHEGWDALRQSIIKIYKKKHKDALKKKRILGETKRKREFLKNSRKAGVGKKNWGASKKR